MALSTYGANAVLDGTAMPATLYAKLHIGNPGAAGTANPAGETTRKAFTRAAASGGATSNVAALTWTAVSTSEDYSHITIWDASSAGNCWSPRRSRTTGRSRSSSPCSGRSGPAPGRGRSVSAGAGLPPRPPPHWSLRPTGCG